MKPRLLVLLFVLPFCFSASGQTGAIVGRVMDSVTQAPLTFATVTVFRSLDSSVITYRLTNTTGHFKVNGLPLKESLKILVSFSGYLAYRTLVEVKGGGEELDLGIIKLPPTAKSLDEVIVFSERPPVIFKKDTVEFNATAFKTLPSSLLEDLLKKLPGVQFNRNGDLSYGGRKVNRLLVDGKAFFGGDYRMATQNLPANVIEKVQIYDDGDELARNNDGDSLRVGKVINVTFKKGVKKGWFGKVYAGGGTSNRYEAGGIGNIYRDTLQLSILGFSNNINRSGFNMKDIRDLGGFSRSGYQSIMSSSTSSRDGFELNGISFGGTEDGLVRTNVGGLNLNHAPDKRFSVFAQVLVGGVKTELQQATDRQLFSLDTTTNNLTKDSTLRTGRVFNVNTGATWKPDNTTEIVMNVGYMTRSNDAQTNASALTSSNKLGQISLGNSSFAQNGQVNNYQHSFSLFKQFKSKRRRSISITHIFSSNQNPIRSLTSSLNNLFNPPGIERLAQLRVETIPTTTASINASYHHQLNTRWSFRAGYEGQFLTSKNEANTYFNKANAGNFDSLVDRLSGNYAQISSRSLGSGSLIYRYKMISFTSKLQWLYHHVDNNFNSGAARQQFNVSNLLYSGQLMWRTFGIMISNDVVIPPVTATNPIVNNNNPFYIIQGNPQLKPEKRFAININGRINNSRTNTQFTFYTSMFFNRDAYIQSTTLSSDGVQKIAYENADHSTRIFGNVTLGKQLYRNKKFKLSINSSLYGSYYAKPVKYNGVVAGSRGYNIEPEASFNFNWNDIVEFNPSASVEWDLIRYDKTYFSKYNVFSNNVSAEVVVRAPKRLVWESNILFRSNGIKVLGLPSTRTYWNMALTAVLEKNERLLLKFAVYDLLNNNNNAYAYTSYNSVVNVMSNVLKRYCMLTLTYNIRNLNADKIGGKRRLFLF